MPIWKYSDFLSKISLKTTPKRKLQLKSYHTLYDTGNSLSFISVILLREKICYGKKKTWSYKQKVLPQAG